MSARTTTTPKKCDEFSPVDRQHKKRWRQNLIIIINSNKTKQKIQNVKESLRGWHDIASLCTSGVQFNQNTLEKPPPSLKVCKIKIYSGGHIVLSFSPSAKLERQHQFIQRKGSGETTHNTKRREKFKIRQEIEEKKCPKIDPKQSVTDRPVLFFRIQYVRMYIYSDMDVYIYTQWRRWPCPLSLLQSVIFFFLQERRAAAPLILFPCSMEMSKRNMSATFLFIPIVRHTSTQ